MEQVDELITWNRHFVGFASEYLTRFVNESKSSDEIDTDLYAELVQLDRRLGIRASEQLYWCLRRTTRSNIIKVGDFLV